MKFQDSQCGSEHRVLIVCVCVKTSKGLRILIDFSFLFSISIVDN